MLKQDATFLQSHHAIRSFSMFCYFLLQILALPAFAYFFLMAHSETLDMVTVRVLTLGNDGENC